MITNNYHLPQASALVLQGLPTPYCCVKLCEGPAITVKEGYKDRVEEVTKERKMGSPFISWHLHLANHTMDFVC